MPVRVPTWEQIRQSFNDLATLTDFGFQGRLTVRYKRLMFSADGTYATLGWEADIGRTSISADIEQRILDMKLFWPVFDSRTPEGTGGIGVWVGAGARYWSTDILLDIVTEPILPGGQPSQDTVEEVEDWWDPELGLALHFPVTPAVGFSVRATGGGFGIGRASSFMWDAEFTALFRVSRRFLVSAGYRQFRYTRSEGDGDEEIDTRVSAIGPQVGFSFGIFYLTLHSGWEERREPQERRERRQDPEEVLGMNQPRPGALQRLVLLTCLLATAPSAAVAQAAQACKAGTISEITFDRLKPFLPEATSQDASLGGVFRFMNSIHIVTTERTMRWELLFEEGDCLDPVLLQESERILRTLPYLSEARVQSEQLADGSHRVNVMTLDRWALTGGVSVALDGGFQIAGLNATAINLFGTGSSVGLFRNSFRERKRVGGLARQPNLFGTRIDGTFHGGETRSGRYFSQSFFRPFTGEVGGDAFRQVAHQRDDYFAYSVEPSLGFSQALIRLEAEQYEATYQHRFGDEVGPRFVAGVGLSREVVRFPFGAAGVRIVANDEFDDPMDAPPEVSTEISPQIRDHATNRASFTIGVRSLHFATRLGLDALRALQDILLGQDLTLTVAPTFRTGDDNVSDVLVRVTGSTGLATGKFYALVDGDFQARKVSEGGEGAPTGWRDVVWEVNGTGYWTFSETSTLTARILYTAGSRMDRPFQLTLGGQEAVRGYDEDAFPGARRLLATLEQRIPFPGLNTSFVDLGLAGFVDAGKIWAGDVPYGATSKWEASVGVGIRITAPSGGQNVLRMDLGLPVTGQREEKGVAFRFYTEVFGLLDRRPRPTQTERSRWYGIDSDLTRRPVNPLAGN